MFQVRQKVKMTRNALDNYGKEYDGIVFEVIHVATMYMKSDEFYKLGRPIGYHPGYDSDMNGQGLYDIRNIETKEYFHSSLYHYELLRAD